MTYEVGDVLWIIHKDRPGLVAYRVVEEITKKTLEGELVQYLVMPAAPKPKQVKLESINGRIFQSREEAKEALLENATKAIDAIVNKTQRLVDTMFFPEKSKNLAQQPIQTTSESDNTEVLKQGYQWVKMEDGTRVQVKLPEIMR